jgi:hypothetical protein
VQRLVSYDANHILEYLLQPLRTFALIVPMEMKITPNANVQQDLMNLPDHV